MYSEIFIHRVYMYTTRKDENNEWQGGQKKKLQKRNSIFCCGWKKNVYKDSQVLRLYIYIYMYKWEITILSSVIAGNASLVNRKYTRAICQLNIVTVCPPITHPGPGRSHPSSTHQTIRLYLLGNLLAAVGDPGLIGWPTNKYHIGSYHRRLSVVESFEVE